MTQAGPRPNPPSEPNEVIPSGFYYLVDVTADFDAKSRAARALPDDQRFFKIRKTAQNSQRGETFAVIEVTSNAPGDWIPWSKMAALGKSMSLAQVAAVDARELGIWKNDDPAWIHTADELATDLKNLGKDAAAAALKPIWDGAKWALGIGAFAIVAILIFKAATSAAPEEEHG